VELRLFPGTPQELRLLSVHLKSGCAREPLESARASCAVLARQVPILERWIDARANEHIPFAVLGDFNRDLRREPPGGAVWPDLDDGDPPSADLVNTAEGQAFQNCMPSQIFSGFIDYIVLGRQMAQGLVPDSFGRALFRPEDAQRRKLSDHCPVFIRVRVADAVRAMP
jgi:endonuclease/exonuclease/phosphatase family metal-dependent hydrolase